MNNKSQLSIGGNALSGEEHKPGMECPECKFFMEFSIVSLLRENKHVCPGCGLCLTMDRSASRGAMQALNQLQTAVENIDSTRNKVGGT